MKILLSQFNKYFQGKKVLVTGHSGFKGKWLCRILKIINSEVYGFSSYPLDYIDFGFSNKSDLLNEEFIGDICNYELSKLINIINPDYIFHFAAQALVNKSILDPITTFKTNTIGTCQLLEALRGVKKKCNVVLITSDKVYQNKEWVWGYRETDSLGGIDPYSASKAMAEIAIKSYLNTFDYLDFDTKIAVARAGNVIGGGDWSKDRLIPDLIRSRNSSEILKIRSPNATRPWQHVLDPLFGYLNLAIKLENDISMHGESFNFGPLNQERRSVISICDQVKKIIPQIQFEVVERNNKECTLLQLDCNKAIHFLSYSSRFNSYQSVDMSIMWYKEYIKGVKNLKTLVDEQINS